MNTSRLGLAVLGVAVLGSTGTPGPPTVTDTASLSESIATQAVYARTAADTTTLSESVAWSVPSAVTFTGQLGTVDSQLGRIEFGVPSEGPPAGEITATDTTSTSESVARALAASRAASDTVSTSESVTGSNVYVATASDTVSVSDSVGHALGASRGASDTTSLTEQPSAAAPVSRMVTDSVAPELYRDDFSRASADIGDSRYTLNDSSGGSASVNGSELTVPSSSYAQWNWNAAPPPDGSFQFDFWVPADRTDSDITYGLDLKQQSVAGITPYVELTAFYAVGTQWSVTAFYYTTGFNQINAFFTPDASSWYTAKLDLDASARTIKVKVWKRGATEPDWMASASGLGTRPGSWDPLLFVFGGDVEEGRLDNLIVTAPDRAFASHGVSRSATDVIPTTESVSGDLNVQFPTDTIVVTDSVGRSKGARRTVIDTRTTTGTPTRRLAAKRSVADTTSVSEDVSAYVNVIPRSASDTISTSESLTRQTAARRSVSDTRSLTETVARSKSTSVSVDDTTSLTEAVTPFGMSSVIATDSVTTTDSVARLAAHVRIPAETTRADDWVQAVVVRAEDIPVTDPTDPVFQTSVAEDAPAGSTAVVVTSPGWNQPPFTAEIDGEIVTVIAVDGNTWTLASPTTTDHFVGSPIVYNFTPTSSRPRPIRTEILLDGKDKARTVDFKRSRWASFANGVPGTCEVWIKDVAGEVFDTRIGAHMVVKYRGVRMWGGYVMSIQRTYAFPAGVGDAPGARYFVLRGFDYNGLFERRLFFDRAQPTHVAVKRWKNGTPDAAVLTEVLSDFSNVGGDNLSTAIQHVGTPALVTTSCNPDAPDWFRVGMGGEKLGDVFSTVAHETGAVFYIDPDKVVHYVDDSDQHSAFGYTGISDAPSGLMIGAREIEYMHDGSKLVNEQYTWGVGQGRDEVVVGHSTDAGSIDTHGLWQGGELRYDMYCQDTVDRRARTWVYGSPQNHRGGNNDQISVRCTMFVPYFRVSDVIDVELTSFGVSQTMPVRGIEFDFPTPWDIRVVLTASHEIDQPWNTYEFLFPDFDLDVPYPAIPDIDIPGFPGFDPCAANEVDTVDVTNSQTVGAAMGLFTPRCVETFTRSVVDGIGASEVPGGMWTSAPYFSVDGDELVIQRPDPDLPGAQYSSLSSSIGLPVEILFTARWEKDAGVLPGPPHGPNSAEAYGVAQFILSTASSGSGVAPLLAPWELLSFRLNRDSDTLEDYVSVSVGGDGPGPADSYATGGYVPTLLSPTESFMVRWRLDSDMVRLKVWAASGPEPGLWSVEFSRASLASGYSTWSFRALLSSESGGEIGFVHGVRLYIDEYVLVEPCTDGITPCDEGIDLSDPSGGEGFEELECRFIDDTTGNLIYATSHQFQPKSSEVWINGLRIRLDIDYEEDPRNRHILIYPATLTEFGIVACDEDVVVTANYREWIIEEPLGYLEGA